MQRPRPQAPITPSASPVPPSGSRAFFPAPYRIAEDSPPLKRQRHSSSPRHARASSSATPDDFNIGREREASAMRMFDVWSQLAEKYTRRIDEDDIVDLVTGEIVKDRGVLSAEIPWKIGRFADIDDSTGSDEEDEDDVDELDALAGSEAKEEEISVHRDGWTVPPVRKMDPADAKDLEEFMEAEKRRREECGDEEASEEDGDVEEHQRDAPDSADDCTSEIVPPPPKAAPPASHSHTVEVEESDDELNFLDGSNIVYLVDEKKEVIEILDSPSVSPNRSTASIIAALKPKTRSHSKTTPNPRPTSKSPATPKSQSTAESRVMLKARATPKSRPDMPHPRLQLHTPPQSRTPSSVLSSTDDFDIPFASPPSPSRYPVPVPRVDLAEMSRGRSALKNTRARTSVPKGGAGQPQPSTRSKVAEPDSRRRNDNTPGASSSSKIPVLSTDAKRRDKPSRSSSALLPSTPEPKYHPPLKEEKGMGGTSPDASNRKGKSRLIEAEQPVDDDEESSDPLALPPSPIRRGRPQGTSVMRRSPRNKHPAVLGEYASLPRSPGPLPRSARKRKRKSMSSDAEDSNRIGDSIHDTPASFLSLDSPSRSTARRSPSVSAKFKSKREVEEGASYSDSGSEPESESLRASSHRHPRPVPAMPPYYPPPGSFYPYPPFTPGTDIHPAMPLQDPRAQFIISQAMQQAMHQLSTLYAAPWSAQPFTPPRHPPSARSASSSGSSPYYPTTPHHPHTHPYVFNSGASMGTLPPSSPPGSSPASSPVRGAGRRASLVPRSRSRGRRVSFRLDEELRDNEVDLHGDSSDPLPARHEARTSEEIDDTPSSSPSKPKHKDKGKKKMMDSSLFESEPSDPGSRSNARPRIAERAQTPGPSIARTDMETVTTADSIQRRSSSAKGKMRKPI
ncbi:hypothetical protein B0H17DRAFT_1083801 [Mycena rosella]|uniref:Uncharacterized protein n=1 Tax=Mycena rosella TaxID=1033263 RepID=A0AAD7D090_MYCRO|nr:hypothetical protein B0H17DRAFT_1083801 [Mycena rosella]